MNMKKSYTLIIMLVLFITAGFRLNAQVPQGIPYQGEARNASGGLLSNQAISLRLSVHDVSSGGAVIYVETKNTSTNSLGLFDLVIGHGTPVTGTFTGINWGVGAKFIQVE